MKLAQVSIQDTFGSSFGGSKTIGDLVTTGINIAFVGAGILILFMLVYAGFQIVAGAGSNNPQNAEKAKAAATSAAIGFVVIFVAYWIIKLIEAITGYNFITEPTL